MFGAPSMRRYCGFGGDGTGSKREDGFLDLLQLTLLTILLNAGCPQQTIDSSKQTV